MKIAYTSRRPFPDGPVTEIFPENDPANIAFALKGDYFSFFTLKKLTPTQLTQKLAGYDLVFLPLDCRDFESVKHIAAGCNGRYATYSEGGIADYQMLLPGDQVAFLQIINRSVINFLYWEKYVSFYRTLTPRPVEFLPYPFYHQQASVFRLPLTQKPQSVTLPSGLAGATRNGLASLAAAKNLLEEEAIEQINCWLSAVNFEEDAQAVQHFILGSPYTPSQKRLNWRRWLIKTGIDYRRLLQLKRRVVGTAQETPPPPPMISAAGLAIYRRRTWHHYLPKAANSLFIIDLNNRETVGRNALDAAALGIPCLSTNRSDMQARLFPATTIEESWDIAGAVAIGKRLVKDVAFYHEVTDHAMRQLEQFGEEGFLQRWQSILTRYNLANDWRVELGTGSL